MCGYARLFVPTLPQNLAVRAVSETQAELTWELSTNNEAVMGYYVWLSGQRVTTITDPSCKEYTFKRLKPPLTQYTFAVSAFDVAGNEGGPCALTRIRRREGGKR